MWLDFAELQPLLRQNERSLQTFLSQQRSLGSDVSMKRTIFTNDILKENKTTQRHIQNEKNKKRTESTWREIQKSLKSLYFTLLYHKYLLIAMQICTLHKTCK